MTTFDLYLEDHHVMLRDMVREFADSAVAGEAVVAAQQAYRPSQLGPAGIRLLAVAGDVAEHVAGGDRSQLIAVAEQNQLRLLG